MKTFVQNLIVIFILFYDKGEKVLLALIDKSYTWQHHPFSLLNLLSLNFSMISNFWHILDRLLFLFFVIIFSPLEWEQAGRDVRKPGKMLSSILSVFTFRV